MRQAPAQQACKAAFRPPSRAVRGRTRFQAGHHRCLRRRRRGFGRWTIGRGAAGCLVSMKSRPREGSTQLNMERIARNAAVVYAQSNLFHWLKTAIICFDERRRGAGAAARGASARQTRNPQGRRRRRWERGRAAGRLTGMAGAGCVIRCERMIVRRARPPVGAREPARTSPGQRASRCGSAI